MTINYSTLPEHMRDGARRYIENGIEPESFLTAVICNDLYAAFAKADHENRKAMLAWVRFFHFEAPAECFGTRADMQAWIARGGLAGKDAA